MISLFGKQFSFLQAFLVSSLFFTSCVTVSDQESKTCNLNSLPIIVQGNVEKIDVVVGETTYTEVRFKEIFSSVGKAVAFNFPSNELEVHDFSVFVNDSLEFNIDNVQFVIQEYDLQFGGVTKECKLSEYRINGVKETDKGNITCIISN